MTHWAYIDGTIGERAVHTRTTEPPLHWASVGDTPGDAVELLTQRTRENLALCERWLEDHRRPTVGSKWRQEAYGTVEVKVLVAVDERPYAILQRTDAAAPILRSLDDLLAFWAPA